MAQFSARALTVRYGAVTALDALDLDIASGEIFVLLGGSGSGKTTLLRCVGGFLAPSSGQLTLDGADITDLPPHRRAVNTMFQSYALFPHLTVAGNIGFGLRGMSRSERDAKVAELLDLVRLQGFATRRVVDLSGGQQQRVALARSLAPGPCLLLLDEPFSALDRALREATRAEFLALLRRLGTTAILVTHDQDEALTSADRIGVLHRGKLEQVGTPIDLYERPRTKFVAAFLGAANVLEATVCRADDDGSLLDLAGGTASTPDRRMVGARLSVALRPERLRLVADRTGPNHVRGVVEAAVYRGSVLDLSVRLPDDSAIRVSHPLSDGLGRVPAPGSEAVVAWAPEACIVLTS